jgi:hypothetical protein
MYKIYASNKNGTQLLDEVSTRREAEYLMVEYRMAYGNQFLIYMK